MYGVVVTPEVSSTFLSSIGQPSGIHWLGWESYKRKTFDKEDKEFGGEEQPIVSKQSSLPATFGEVEENAGVQSKEGQLKHTSYGSGTMNPGMTLRVGSFPANANDPKVLWHMYKFYEPSRIPVLSSALDQQSTSIRDRKPATAPKVSHAPGG
ncbi:unnamed protein product [Tuber aestivum]|uniref:Uncharacterized protein n=1 Tax=Tuber aestivum TaxID=59557 RepID=A0A292PPX6_9PEZI|nr:unnamed protein product [Tuber aestivum]